MGFFDQYKAIKRSTITVDSKQATRDALVQSLNNPTTKSDAIQVVKKLLEFKVEQSRSDTAERLLGGLTTPLESLNAKRGQRTGGDTSITLESLQELVRNRSAIFKRQLPDTFKGLLRDTYLRDGEARAILVNTNTAAFLKSNDLITAAEVRTATPEVGFDRQLFPQDVANMLNSLEAAADSSSRDADVVGKIQCTNFVMDIDQILKDFNRSLPHYKEFCAPSIKRVIRSFARASAFGGLNSQRLLEPQTSIAGINSLAVLKNRVLRGGPGHAWMADAKRSALKTSDGDWVINGFRGETNVSDAGGTSHLMTVSTGFSYGSTWLQRAKEVFGPEILEFGHVSMTDGTDGLAGAGFRRSQRLSPDVQYVRRNAPGAYARDMMELRGARAVHFDSGALEDRPLDTFDMLIFLGVHQGVCTSMMRCTAVSEARSNALREVEIVNATHPEEVNNSVKQKFMIMQPWNYPVRISLSSREVEYVLLPKHELIFRGAAGAPQRFVPYKFFTVRFSWCQRTNFVSKTIVDETPWRCSHHYEWVPPMNHPHKSY